MRLHVHENKNVCEIVIQIDTTICATVNYKLNKIPMLEKKLIKPPNPRDMVEDIGVRKRFGFYKCLSGGLHLWTIVTPPKITKSIWAWYGFDPHYVFKNTSKKRAVLMFECFYCRRIQSINTGICQKCHKVKRTISNKQKSRSMNKTMECDCYRNGKT